MAFHEVVSYHERMRLLLLTVILAFTLCAEAYELMVVQTISASQKSFITRNGKRQGIVPGLLGTFIADDIAVNVKARTVTSQFTQWEVVNENATVPFKTGQVVTYHPSQEYLWALNPEVARKKIVQDTRPKTQHSFLVKGASTRGLNETVSGAAPQSAGRTGIAMDFLYEQQFIQNAAWDVGLRYEKEVVNLDGGSLSVQRVIAVADLLYYFDPLDHFHQARFFLGAGVGFGQSSTDANGATQSGSALLLPSAKAGLTLPFNRQWDFLTEVAFETLKSDEKLEGTGRQTTNQSNLRVGLGLRKYF